MRYLSVCSGIESATVAWHPLGWQCAGVSEIEPFPRAVLEQRIGAVPVEWDHRHQPGSNTLPLFGDFTQIEAHHVGPIDLLVGGTPCQSFSIAGLRGGLADDRGNLALEFLKLAQRTRAKWLVWENVPGVLSSDGGRDFGSILGGLVELGYGFAYRVLDAQFFGVPQRRRRVFVVGHLGDWRRAAAVLFERHSLSGHPAPRREKGQAAPTIPSRSSAGGGLGTDFDCDGGLIASTGDTAHCLNAGGMGRQDYETETLIAHSLRGEGFDASEGGTGRGTPLIAVERVADTLTSNGDAHSGYRDEKGLVAFSIMPMNSGKDYKARETDVAQPIMAGGPVGGNQGGDFVKQASAVRRLTPRECERLMGFPDDYTLIPWRGKPASECPDGPRYKALGNSMAVPCMRWLGERIDAVEAVAEREREAA